MHLDNRQLRPCWLERYGYDQTRFGSCPGRDHDTHGQQSVRSTRCGIPVVYTPGASARAIAEAAFTYMLTLAKKIPSWNSQLKCGNWNSRCEQAKRRNEKLQKEIDSFRAENRQLKDKLFAAKTGWVNIHPQRTLSHLHVVTYGKVAMGSDGERSAKLVCCQIRLHLISSTVSPDTETVNCAAYER